MKSYYLISPSSQRGIALLLTLVALAFLGLSTGLLHRHIFRLAQLKREEVTGLKETEVDWEQFGTFLLDGGRRDEFKSCKSSDVSGYEICLLSGDFKITPSTPAVISPQTGFPRSKQPLWKPSDILGTRRLCLEPTTPPGDLSPSALVSGRTCSTLTTSESEISLDGNLIVLDAPLILSSSSLYVSGAIKIASLESKQAVRIMAGGDILIDSFMTQNITTLISATGAVVVRSYQGVSGISAMSPKGIYIPEASRASSWGEPLPFTRSSLILGRWGNPH